MFKNIQLPNFIKSRPRVQTDRQTWRS